MGDHIEKYITGSRTFNDAPDASAVSPFERLSSAISRVRDLRKFSEVIADRMVGAREAEGVERTLKELAGGGLLDEMERQIGSLHAYVDDIQNDLRRIESRL